MFGTSCLKRSANGWATHFTFGNVETLGSKPSQAGRYNLTVRITKGKVVGGQIVVEGETLTEGSVVTVLASDERTFTLSHEEEAALLEAIAEADRGKLLDAEEPVEARPAER